MTDSQPSDALADHVANLPDGGPCTKDSDCMVAGNACISGAKCDTDLHICVFDVCNVGACKAAVCDTSSTTCTVPVSVNYHATTFHVPSGATGCNGSPGCFAAVFPFVFVGTQGGVVAYQVSDPTNFTPPSVTVSGVTFPPLRIVAVGRRIYFIGNPFGGSPSGVKVPIASLDVPGSPFITTVAATSLTITTPSFTGGMQVFPTDKEAVFLVNADSSRSFPAGLISAPLMDNATINQLPSSGVPAGVGLVASSGSRLVTYRYDGSGFLANFSFETGVATVNASNGGEMTASSMGNVYQQTNFFATGPDGSVLWMAPQGDTPMDGGPFTTNTARMAWLVKDASTSTFDASQHVDVETYNSLGPFASVAGPLAWLDTNTALVLAAAPENMQQTSVQLASRSGGPPTIVNAKRRVVTADVNHVIATASDGYGYVMYPDTNGSDSLVEIYAPSCDVGP
jgi:hypothetical protein